MRLREIQPSLSEASDQHHVAKTAKTGKGTKTLSAGELRVKALADQARKLRGQAKQERARQGLAKAQQRMAKATIG